MKKIVAMIALLGVLSASALAITAQAAGRMTDCCSNPRIVVAYQEYYCGDPTPDHHTVWLKTVTMCQSCGYREISDDWICYEEHDYDIYDLENHRRYCRCGDSFG